MTVGVEPCQADLFKGTRFVGERVGPGSIFAVLFGEGARLFPEGMFDDLFSSRGRRSVPPRVVATVMVLQRWFGLSDREAVAAFEFDARWRYACGGLDVDGGGFSHTVLVGMRARLAASGAPRRIFDATLEVARSAGALSQRRVLDSAPIYDAVATQDTVTMLRAAIRGVFEAADRDLGAIVRGAVAGGDYASRSKPACDWDDAAAREALVATIAGDAVAVLEALEGRALSVEVAQGGELLAAVVGQDLCEDPEGRLVIARRVARDRIISVVDRDARHGHKTAARGFDGYKGHIATDPDSELITATAVTAANAPDARPAPELIADLLTADTAAAAAAADTTTTDTTTTGTTGTAGDAGEVVEDFAGRPTVYGDCAYGSGDFQSLLGEHRINSKCRTQAPQAPAGSFTKDRFSVDLAAATVTLPRRGHRRHQLPPRRRRHRPLRRRLRRLRTPRRLHRRQSRQNHTHRRTRNRPRRVPSAPTEPGLARRLPRHPPQSRTQTRAPHAPTPRRPPRPRARPTQSRRRLQPPRRSRQHRPPRRARTAHPRHPLGTHLNPHPPPTPQPHPPGTHHQYECEEPPDNNPFHTSHLVS